MIKQTSLDGLTWVEAKPITSGLVNTEKDTKKIGLVKKLKKLEERVETRRRGFYKALISMLEDGTKTVCDVERLLNSIRKKEKNTK